MIRRDIEGRHFSSLSPACGLGCVTAGLAVLCWDPSLAWLLPLLGVLLLALTWLQRSLTLLVLLLCGLRIAMAVQIDLAARWPASLDGERVVARCKVLSLPQRGSEGLDLQARCERWLPRSVDPLRPTQFNVQLRMPLGPVDQLPRAGERWQWLLELRGLRSRLNPGAVDAQRQWFRQRTHALARLRPSAFTRRLAAAPPGLLRLRTGVLRALEGRVVDRDARALLAALAVGATGDLTTAQWRAFSATGTTHLVAISGMHVTAFAVVAAWFARRGWSLWRRIASRAASTRIDRERFALLLSLFAATAYAAVAGLSVPTQRTLLMLAFVVWARLSSRQLSARSLLSLAAVAVLLLDPYAPLSPGFWLSFIAVGVLMGLGSLPIRSAIAGVGTVPRSDVPPGRMRTALQKILRAAAQGARLQTLLVLAMLPVTLMLFGSVPLAGLLMNLLAIPLFSIALVPLTLAGMAVLPLSGAGAEWAQPLWSIAEAVWLFAAPLFDALAAWPLALWQPQASVLWLLATPVLALAVLWPLPWRLRTAAAAVLLAPSVTGPQAPLEPGALRLSALDIGDGTAVIVQTRSHALLIDTGDVYGSRGTAVTRVVLPALRAAGLQRLDRLVVSEFSAARVVGAATLLQQMPVAAISAPGPWPGAPRPVERCSAANSWYWDEIRFEWLDAGPGSQAAFSCVLRIHAAGGRILLPVAATAAQQRLLLRAPHALSARLVVVPRHGALSAQEPAFSSAVRPQWALALAAKPAGAAVRSLWRSVGAEWLSTADDGALILRLSASEGLQIERPFVSFWRWPWRWVEADR